jgi:hypothetical protein
MKEDEDLKRKKTNNESSLNDHTMQYDHLMEEWTAQKAEMMVNILFSNIRHITLLSSLFLKKNRNLN